MSCACAGGIGKYSVSNALPAVNQNAQFHPNEPSGPSVKTAVPGPKSLQRLAELSRIQVILSDIIRAVERLFFSIALIVRSVILIAR